MNYNAFVTADDVRLDDFVRLCDQQTCQAAYPHCTEVQSNVLIYDAQRLREADRQALLEELHRALLDGPGVLVVRRGFSDLDVVDRHSAVFEAIFAEQARSGNVGDHFAKAGSNGRIWNSLQKSALLSPASYVEYYANPLITLIAQAWLGPNFQMSAQVNVVRPGGQAQQPHRDYHLGFQTVAEVQRYPVHLQILSQQLTLQGAVAHTDMPLESGPTQLLPYSHQYPLGYLAWRRDDFIEYFQANAVQLPLAKGDFLFFNPALFHAAGSNKTATLQRMANLLQVSAAFGKPMETVNRERMMLAIYPHLLAQQASNSLDEQSLAAVIACTADGYSFPSNLDTDPPLHGLAPQTGQQLMHQALSERWPYPAFAERVAQMCAKRLA